MGNRKQLLIASGVVLIAMVLASLWAWFVLPGDARVPIHWNVRGEVDGYGDKAFGLFLAPVVTAAVSGLFALLPAIEPRRKHLMQSSKLYTAIWIGLLALMAIVHALIITTATGLMTGPTRLPIAGVGLLFIVLGNYLGKSRSTFFMGIRTPWTLSSELSWRKTHRLGGWLFMALGLAMIVTVFAAPALLAWVVLGGVGATVLVVTVYSYIVWKNDPERHSDRPLTPTA